MPHIVIEHSEDIPVLPQVLVEKVHQAAFESGLFSLDAIKTRAVAYQHYQLGEGKEGFVHINAHIMSGRNDAQKQALADGLLACLTRYCRHSDCLSVDIHELSPHYSKL